MANKSRKALEKAVKNKNDEFYTRREDIEKELCHYKEEIKEKIIYCPADQYKQSHFYKFFKDNFKELKIKKLIATAIGREATFNTAGIDPTIAIYDGKEERVARMRGTGDLRSYEAKEIIDYADVIITNPPYSIEREFVVYLLKIKKPFLLIAPQLLLGYNEIFAHYIEKRIKSGYTKIKNGFINENGDKVSGGNSLWITSLYIKKKEPKPLTLNYNYRDREYKKLINYDAIHIPRINYIPKDYKGKMAISIASLTRISREQFDIIGVMGNTRSGKNRYAIMGDAVYVKKKSGIEKAYSAAVREGGKIKALFCMIIIKLKNPI